MAELRNKLIVLVGPTAVGKTSLSIEIAKKLKCEIVSTDSRQFYSEMTIGTAKPSAEQLNEIQHHFINSRSVQEYYTAGMFEKDAIQHLDEIFKTNDYAIAVGGSGLYVNALCYGIDDIPTDVKVRDEIEERWKKEGLEPLQAEVKEIDPEYYAIADMKNPRRVMRALEVYALTGKKLSTLRNSVRKKRNFDAVWIGLEEDTESLYERINQRVDEMVVDGLVKEVESLLAHKDLKALNTVGYQEIINHLEGNIDLTEAIELVKRNSRRFAKKQYTWFRKNPDIKWFTADQTEEIMSHIQSNK